MGETVIRHCDFCLQEAAGIKPDGRLNIHGVELTLALWMSPVWGDKEFVTHFKGELCPRCMTRLREAIARAFEHTKAELAPGRPANTSCWNAWAELCASCGNTRAWHKEHRPRHPWAKR